MADAPHLDGEASSIDGTWRDIGLSAVLVAAFERWDCIRTSRGAVVEAEALQDSPGGPLRFHWVHLLDVSGGRIQRDTVYCTGGVISESTLAQAGLMHPAIGGVNVPL